MADTQLEHFFRQNFPVIWAKCARMLGEGEEAADVAQETFMRLIESGLAEREPALRAVWIYRTSTRLAIDRLRRRRLGIERRDDRADAVADGAAADDLLAARQSLLAIAACTPADELEAAILCRVDGLTHAEAAEVSGISERTVRRQLDRFDARLAALEETKR